jgi:hypothetical protein
MASLNTIRIERGDMGGHPWFYYVPYQPDIDKALQELKQTEFAAGRYNPMIRFPEFPIDPDSPTPGPGHSSIKAALRSSMEDGTRSILDMDTVSPGPRYCAVSPLPQADLLHLYGTTQPTRELVEDLLFLEDAERGQGLYIILYKDGVPSEILFAGYSFD